MTLPLVQCAAAALDCPLISRHFKALTTCDEEMTAHLVYDAN